MPEVVISPVAKALTLVRAARAPPDSALRGSLYSNAKAKGEGHQCRMLGLFSWPAIQCQNERRMKHELSSSKKIPLAGAVMLFAFAILLRSGSAQTPHKSDAGTGVQISVQQELVRIETGFFEAWKTKDQTYFREHMPENGIFWGESGAVSRDQRLAELQASAKTCTVEGYGLSDFGALPLAAGAYLLTYKAEQYATCNGEKVPVHLNGSSIYIFKAGHWQAIYRAEVPLKNPN